MNDNLRLREANHRCSNDLQLVVALLQLASRRTNIPETHEVLNDTANRVAILASARRALAHNDQQDLEATLLEVVSALAVLAEPR